MKMSRKHSYLNKLSGSIFLLVSALACTSVLADEMSPVYTMTVIVDAAQGRKVAAGEYDRAIAKLAAKKSRVQAYETHTNLCVAYTKTGDVERATIECEAAVAAMRKRDNRARSSFVPQYVASANRAHLAVALSNLGVLEVVKGKPEAARERFEQALELDSKLVSARVNIERLAQS